MVKGIDVSKHQGKIDWAKTKSNGVEFAIIRASCSMHTDERLAMNVLGCNSNKIPFGFYHTLYADSVEGAKTEAKIFLESIKGHKPEYPIYVDTEFWTENGWTNTKLSRRLWTDMVIAFGDMCEKAGYYFGVYASRSFIQNTLIYDELKRFDFWLAEWDVTIPTWKGNYGLWQYSVRRGNQADYGMPQTNGLDMNFATKDYPSIIKSIGLNGFTNKKVEPKPSTPAPKPTAPLPKSVKKPVVQTLKRGTKIRIKEGAIDLNTRGKYLPFVYKVDRFVMNDVGSDGKVIFGDGKSKLPTGVTHISNVIRK